MTLNRECRVKATQLLTALVVLIILSAVVLAQGTEQSQYDRGTPPQHAAGVSAIGSYMSADLGTINLGNGSLNFKLPLGSVGGRGFWLPLTLNYSHKVWSADRGSVHIPEPLPGGRDFPTVWAVYNRSTRELFSRVGPGWTVGAAPFLQARGVGIGSHRNQVTGCTDFNSVFVKLTLVLPDQGEIELRDDQLDGAPVTAATFPASGCRTQDNSQRGRRWHATDGSGIIFINEDNNGVSNGNLNGKVITSDGTRYHFSNEGIGTFFGTAYINNFARCDWVEDRNGNRITIDYLDGFTVRYTDQLGRFTTIQWDDPLGTRLVDPENPGVILALLVTLPGANGGVHYYKVKTGVMHDNYRGFPNAINPALPVYNGNNPGAAPPTVLFNGSEDQGTERIDDKIVVTDLILPDGRALRFKYNEYGEVAEVQMPTGGKVQYDFAAMNFDSITHKGLPVGNSLAAEAVATGQQYQGNVLALDRAVVARRTYPDGTTLEGQWSYDYTATLANGLTTGTTEVKCISVSGQLLLDQWHFFLPAQRFLTPVSGGADGTGNALWSTGLERRVEMRDTNGTTVLGATEQDWSQRAAVTWTTGYTTEQIANDNRVNVARNILDDLSMSRVVTTYDNVNSPRANNPKRVDEYDFDGTLKRYTTISYLMGSPYENSGVNSLNLVRLPLQQSVFDGPTGVEMARTNYEYDNYASDGNNLPLSSYTDFASIPGHTTSYDAGFTTRANPTRVTRMISGAAFISSYTRYDVLGNVVSVKDPRGNVASINYLDDFGTGSNPGSNTGGHSTYALPTKLTSPPPNPGEPPQTAFSQYDYATGLLTGFKDRNGVIAQTLYNDPFDRPTLIKVGLGIPGIETHTAIYYAGLNPLTVYGVTLSNNDVLTAKDQTAKDDANLRSWTQTDGFGRPLDQVTSDPQGDVRVTSSYDGLGRVKRVSNPYRSLSEPTYGYADTSYDLAGRVRTVTTADQAVVTTDYSGARVLVIDQANKKRLSRSDGLGRLVEVWEITTADAASEGVTFPGHGEVTAGYRSRYSYDALDDLVMVKQQVGASGTLQTRTFEYDGLKRLIRATNPESGVVQYSYDNNSNLQTKTDARMPAVTTTYQYDALNRVKTRTYSDSTPGVSYGYEKNASGAVVANAVGRLTFVSSPVSTSSYGGYDALGRVLQSTQTTVVGTSQSYAMSYEYNLASEVTAETYPSGRKVMSSYDAAGRLSGVSGQKTGEANKSYTNGFSYTAHGAVTAMTLGNGLIEQTAYNNRLQPTQIKLGTAGSGASVVQLDYGYETAGQHDNNGNVRKQTINVPTTGGTVVMTQSYAYDALNRLQSMSESNGGWTQSYGYDRYGNRWVAAGQVPSPPLTPQSAAAFNGASNRLNPAVMVGYGYDAVGNVTSDPTTLANGIVYDAENRQVSYTKAGVTTSYSYDGDGRRVKKVTSGSPTVTTVYVYDAMERLVAEYTDSSQPQGSGTKYVTADTLGSTRVVTSQSQAVVARYDYLPFGEEMGAGVGLRTAAMGYSATENTRQKFTAKERDNESGLDYFLARYYSSAQGRFTSPDEFQGGPHEVSVLGSGDKEKQALPYADITDPQSLNKYQYGLNNPLRYVDPDGHQQKESQESLAEKILWAFRLYWAAFASDTAKQQVGSDPAAEAVMDMHVGSSSMTGRDAVKMQVDVMKVQGEQLQTILDIMDPSGVISGVSGKVTGMRSNTEVGIGIAVGLIHIPGGGSISKREAVSLVGAWARDPVKDTISASIRYHYGAHGAEVGAKNVWQYLRKAEAFASNLKGATKTALAEGKVRYAKDGRYIILDANRKIVTFGNVR